jgi:hypothetical protein
MGDIGPLQRLYGTVQAIGSELGGGDMGTPFGQRFGESQKATKAEVKRLQELRKAHPEEFGRGMMFAQEQQDPYMLGLGVGSMGAMRPMGVTTFSPAREMPSGPGMLEGPAGMRGLPAPAPRMLGGPQGMTEAAPVAPYYRNVPPEMGTSMRPMTPFQQNQVGLSTGRFGTQGYAPEMAVTDFESYAPGGMGRTTTGPTPMNKFDQNMMDAYRRGRMGTGASRGMYGEYTPEEMGSAIVPYRQGGLVYEPVGGPQGAAPRQIGGPQSGGLPTMAQGRGMRPTLIEGEFSEVPPQGQIPYGMGYRPNFTMEGGTYTPSMGAAEQFGAGTQRGYRGFGPLGAGLGVAAGPGVMYMADRTERPVSSLSNNPMQPSNVAPASPLYGTSPEGYPTFGIMPGAEGMNFINRARQGAGPEMPKGAGRRAAGGGAVGGGQKAVPLPPTRPEGLGDTGWEGNLNYLVTSLIDRISGQGEAERGRNTQEYYATNPWPY